MPRPGRLAALAIVAVTSPVWAAASVPAPPVDAVSSAVVAAITAGRPTGYRVGGLDLSSHDHERFAVRWSTEVAAGSRFVYVKATEGTRYVNPFFDADYAAARATGGYVGAYVFARPDLGDPVGQAEHFLRHARFSRDSRTLVPFVDLESAYPDLHTDRCYNRNPPQLRAWIRAFVDRIAAGVGRRPMIYTNTDWWNPCTGRDASFGGYPLDIADYRGRVVALPAGWSRFAVWQYAPGDPGRPSDHDRDVVVGDLTGLAALAADR